MIALLLVLAAQEEAKLTLVAQDRGCSAFHSLAVAPDGATIAVGVTAARAGEVWFFDLSSGKKGAEMGGHKGAVVAIAFGGSGKLMVTGGREGTIKVWQFPERSELREIRVAHHGKGYMLQDASVSPDGRFVAAAPAGEGAAFLMWDTYSGEFKAGETRVKGFSRVTFAPDSKSLVVAGGARGFGLIYDETGKETGGVASSAVQDASFSPDGKLLAAAGSDGKVLLWDVAGAKVARTLEAKGASFRKVAFSPDGISVAAADLGGLIRVWPASGGKAAREFQAGMGLLALAWTADSQKLVTLSPTSVIQVWSATK